MKRILLLPLFILLLGCEEEPDPDQYGYLMDIDINSYKTIKIGKQTWMAENLRTTRYADGTAIPQVENGSEWFALGIDDKAYCWYDNSTDNRAI